MSVSRWHFRAWLPDGRMEKVADIRLMDDVPYVFTEHEDGHIGEAGTECVLMQSTGLVDSEGVEIFEGDILRCVYDERHTDVVVFEHGKFTGQLFELHRELGTSRKWKVIGNRYQNRALAQELESWALSTDSKSQTASAGTKPNCENPQQA